MSGFIYLVKKVMASFQINKRNVLAENDYNFIAIGDPQKLFGAGGLVNSFKKKIFRQGKSTDTSGFWATLGRQDNGPILDRWSGTITCSRNGNQDFSNNAELVASEVAAIRNAFPEENLQESSFTQRFISFDEVSFSNVGGASDLRLTIMVKETEQAVVFIQHTDEEDELSATGVAQYLVPEAPEDLGKRDRLTYYFSVSSIPGALSTRFVIKVLTFERTAGALVSANDVQGVFKKLDNPYGFTKYMQREDGANIYTPVDPAGIDRNKKTLFLFHGTFSSIIGSYGDLLNGTWFPELLAKGKYEQVIGFDHYTMVESPFDNANVFFSLLEPGGAFAKPADIITTSRGGLVGKCVLNHDTQQILKFERAATVACANGVAYFDVAEKLGKFLSVMRQRSSEISTKIIFAALQFGINQFVGQPGLKIMKKDDEGLAEILSKDPAHPNLRYFPICGDYKYDRGSEKLKMKVLDLLISGIMDSTNHDWVVETDYQVKMPADFLAYKQPVSFFRNQPIDSIHTSYFKDSMTTVTKKKIADYLHDSDQNVMGTTGQNPIS